MKELFKIEFERAFKSKTFWLSLAIGIGLILCQIVTDVIPTASNPLKYFRGEFSSYPSSMFNTWIGFQFADSYVTAYLTLFPLLAALPYALSYHTDTKNGYVKGIYTRTKKINYLFTRYVTVFVSGGLAVVLPYIISLIVTSCMMPSLLPVKNGMFILNGTRMLWEVFYSHPCLYILIFLLIYFIYGGIFATVALAATGLVENIFLLTITPFIVYYGLSILSPYIKKIWSYGIINPIWMLDMTQPKMTTPVALLSVALVVGLVSAFIYFRNGVKKDVL